MFSNKKMNRAWSLMEQDLLKKLVEEFGTTQWKAVSQAIARATKRKRRSPKQCRDQWLNYLQPGLRFDLWSKQEEINLFKLWETLGCKWAQIAKQLPGRSENAVKNRFYSAIRRMQRKYLCEHPKEVEMKGKILDLVKDKCKIFKLLGSSMDGVYRRIRYCDQGTNAEQQCLISFFEEEQSKEALLLEPLVEVQERSVDMSCYNTSTDASFMGDFLSRLIGDLETNEPLDVFISDLAIEGALEPYLIENEEEMW